MKTENYLIFLNRFITKAPDRLPTLDRPRLGNLCRQYYVGGSDGKLERDVKFYTYYCSYSGMLELKHGDTLVDKMKKILGI